MKKSVTLCALPLLLIVLASASSRTMFTNINVAATATDPQSVPGSINRGNGAVVRPGYIFVRRGDEVDVVPVNGHFKTGTYVCSCRSSNANGKCELLFSPRQIFCKQGSCIGASCRLVPVEPTAIQ